MATSLVARLSAAGLPFEEMTPMARRTTLKVGGPAACWVCARGEGDIRLALSAAREARAEVTVVGNGSNLLVRDGGIAGLTLCVGGDMARVSMEGTSVFAQAGARLAQIALAAQAAGLSGMEALSGIPGTLGGALAMNAGAYGVQIGELVSAVEALDMGAERVRLPAALMDFGYRRSALSANGWIATGATLALRPDDPAAIARRMLDYARARREKQPLSLPSAGSFFKRPQGAYAGALIEAAGLKGYVVGGAQVSALHAGFFVNIGGAVADDFLRLMAHVQETVRDHSGVWLEPEVRILGDALAGGPKSVDF